MMLGIKYKTDTVIKMINQASELRHVKCSRAGVIMYTIYKGTYYFLLARDRRTKELGDFGGGRQKDESALEAAQRELKEEGNEVFDTIAEEYLENGIALYDEHMAIIFMPLIDKSWLYMANFLFNKKTNVEVSEIVWLHEKDFLSFVWENKNHHIWNKVRKFISENIAQWLLYASLGDKYKQLSTPKLAPEIVTYKSKLIKQH